MFKGLPEAAAMEIQRAYWDHLGFVLSALGVGGPGARLQLTGPPSESTRGLNAADLREVWDEVTTAMSAHGDSWDRVLSSAHAKGMPQ